MKWLSIIPALIIIILTFKTKKLIPALVAGIIVGSFFQAKSLVGGYIYIGEQIVGALSDKGDAGTVWAGGAVLNVVSPLSAEMAGISYGNHLVTSLPFVLFGVVLSTTGYVISGWFYIESFSEELK